MCSDYCCCLDSIGARCERRDEVILDKPHKKAVKAFISSCTQQLQVLILKSCEYWRNNFGEGENAVFDIYEAQSPRNLADLTLH